MLACLIALVVFLARGGSVSGIVNHPWWRGSVSRGQVDRMISAIHTLKPRDMVIIFSNGTFEMRRDDSTTGGPLTGTLGGLEDHTEIIFYGGYAGQDVEVTLATGREIEVVQGNGSRLLKHMLDKAHASEVRWRRTGKGNTNIDVILQNQFQYSND